jgi:hypothetical protein
LTTDSCRFGPWVAGELRSVLAALAIDARAIGGGVPAVTFGACAVFDPALVIGVNELAWAIAVERFDGVKVFDRFGELAVEGSFCVNAEKRGGVITSSVMRLLSRR